MRVALFVALVVGLCGCAQFQGAPPETPAWDPDARAQELRAQWVGAPDYPTCSVRGPTGLPAKARTRIRKDAEALVFCHPRHVEARMLAAILAYEERDPVRATQHLDDVLVLNPTHPEAAVLRSRIAVEAGNAPYAISLLESQIQLSPDHAGLREALASAYFLAGRHDEARAALDAADSLGAPQWRVAYNRGLVEEDAGNLRDAADLYRMALDQNPGSPMITARLRGIEITPVEAPPAPPADAEPPPSVPPASAPLPPSVPAPPKPPAPPSSVLLGNPPGR